MTLAKIKPLDKEVALELAGDFLERFEYCCNQSKAPVESDLIKHLSKNFQISTNGEIAAKNLNEYLSMIGRIQKKYSHVEVSNLTVDVLSSGYQIVARYTIFLTPRGGKTVQIEFMAIASIEENRFTNWSSVASEHGPRDWQV